MTLLPLLRHHQPDDPVAWYRSNIITCDRFLADVAQLSECLPNRRYVLNLCEDRYHFLVGFGAALIRSQISLFPPSRAPKQLQQLREEYDDICCILDQGEPPADIEALRYEGNDAAGCQPDMLFAPDDMVAALVFTSGTTGRPQAHSKTWGSLVSVATRTASRFALEEGNRASIVATVPPQHMYGLETSIMLPLQSRSMVHSGRPFYPHDIAHALETMPAPRILVTTPVHIRACLTANISLPPLAFVLSATAPLPVPLASEAEEKYACPVLEIYGCTEAGVIATRRTTSGETWDTLDGVTLRGTGDQCTVHSDHLAAPVPLNDVVNAQNDRQLTLLGRKTDLINIAGKRMSLDDLNHKLRNIGGVIDGIFVMPEERDGPVTRLMAFVVAPSRSRRDILAELSMCVDPVFLPRPLYLVDHLPRNETGKLTRAELLQLAIVQDAIGKSAHN